MNARDDLNRDPQRVEGEERHQREGTEISVEAMEAGPAGVVEREVTVRDAGSQVARGSRAEDDAGLEQRVDRTTEKALHKAGDALQRAAPTIGRGTEKAVSGTGAALSAASGALGTMVGKIAGRVGGWWESASQAMAELPEEEQQACMVHFETYELRPTGMTFERALPGYTLGYVAARNPAYRGRPFEEIEPELRHGFGEPMGAESTAMRDFSRYGYERGTAGL